MNAHAKESGHFYDREGKPVFEVAGSKGMVNPDIRHARKLGLLPGVTSIIRCAAQPGLELWKTNQAILSALTLPRVEGESNDALLVRIRQDAQEQAKKAREHGTEVHAAIQGYYEGKQPEGALWPFVDGMTKAIEARFGLVDEKWIAEQSFAHPLGFGGKTDLHGHVVGTGVVLDFKGSDFTDGQTLKTWDEHHMQLAAYREGLGMQSAACCIAYFSRTVPGLCQIIEVPEEELKRGWAMFKGLLAYWMASRNYWPNQ